MSKNCKYVLSLSRVVSTVIVSAVILLPSCALAQGAPPIPTAAINIDGAVDDWDSVDVYIQDENEGEDDVSVVGSDIEYIKLAYSPDNTRLSILLKTADTISQSLWYRMFFVHDPQSQAAPGNYQLDFLYSGTWDIMTQSWHSQDGYDWFFVDEQGAVVVSGAFIEADLAASTIEMANSQPPQAVQSLLVRTQAEQNNDVDISGRSMMSEPPYHIYDSFECTEAENKWLWGLKLGYAPGEQITFRWHWLIGGPGHTVKLTLQVFSDGAWSDSQVIAAAIPEAQRSFTWTIPHTTQRDTYFRVLMDESDATDSEISPGFRILTASDIPPWLEEIKSDQANQAALVLVEGLSAITLVWSIVDVASGLITGGLGLFMEVAPEILVGAYVKVLRDPPDHDYETEVTVIFRTLPQIDNTVAMPQPLFDAIIQSANIDFQRASYLEALLHTGEKQQGAAAADDDYWEQFHQQQAHLFLTQLSDLSAQQITVTEQILSLLADYPEWDIAVTGQQLLDFQQMVQANGLPQLEEDILALFDPSGQFRQETIGRIIAFQPANLAPSLSQAVSTRPAIEQKLEELFTKSMMLAGGEVTIPDPALEEAIRDEFQLHDEPLQYQHLYNLYELHANEMGIANLAGLEFCPNLRIVELAENSIADISPMLNLKHLQYLDLGQNQITDITMLANAENLAILDLANNNISDIFPLSALSNLVHVDLAVNPLNAEAYCTYLPLIRGNNQRAQEQPALAITHDPNPNPFFHDCSSDFNDFAAFASHWLDTNCDQQTGWCGGADLDHIDGVDFKDLAVLMRYWLARP